MNTIWYLIVTIFYGFLLYELTHVAFKQWLKYINAKFMNSYSWVTLEIKLPRETNKSPVAMETVLEAFYQGGGLGTWYDKFWKGNMLSWFSFEIASFGGEIHFYIRTHKKFKNIIESNIYAQYPNIEIYEIEDYTKTFKFDSTKHGMMGTNFVLTGADFLPLKTYVDYGLDGNPKEEYKIDPITPMLEFLGSIKQGEQIWYQILFRSDKFVNWKAEAKEEVKAMMKRDDKQKETEEAKAFSEGKLTFGEKEKIKIIERSVSKNGFEVFIRSMYMADKDKFDGNKVSSFMGMLKSFGSGSFNGFAPQDDTSFVFPWQDNKKGSKLNKKKDRMFKVFVLRLYGDYLDIFDSFSLSYEINSRIDKLLRHGIKYNKAAAGKSKFILNTEELATLFHFPGSTASAPSLKRISSTKSEPPSNLPI